jgi:hypothetical protein
MNEKICPAPGANSGIGKVTAKALAAGVRAKYPRVHALVNNVGSYNGVQSGCNVICRLGCAPAQATRK